MSLFEQKEIRRILDSEKSDWYFSVINIVGVLTEQDDYKKARKYWNKLSERLRNEGSELVTDCDQLKMKALDGKMRLTDVLDTTKIKIIFYIIYGK